MKKLSLESLLTSSGSKNIKYFCFGLQKKCYFLQFNQQDSGFSMVELIAVVLMIGILAVLAIPSWLSFINKQQINKANDALLAALQEAQKEAKKKKLSYSVSFKVENNIPKIAIHPDSTAASALSANQWQYLGENAGVKADRVTLLTNLTAKNTAGSAVDPKPSFLNTPQTITFDYLGTLTNANFGTIPNGSTEPPGLKIVVTAPKPGSSTTTLNVKRCVIIKTLLGSMLVEKDNQCS